MSREFEKSYRLRASDDVLKKMNGILQGIDQRLDEVEQARAAFLAGNRLDVDALLKKVTDDIALKSAAMQELLDETEEGFTPDRIHETAAHRFTSDAEQEAHSAAIAAANVRIDARATSAALGAHTARNDNPHAVTASQVGTLTALEILEDLDVLLAEILGTASPSMDTLGKVETALATITAALGKRVRVDAAQGFTSAEKGQALANLGAGLLSGRRNDFINGNFSFWQRGTSQTTNGYGSADRWYCGHNAGSTKNVSQQAFALGQTDVPGNPTYYLRTEILTSAGETFVSLYQRVEGVRRSSGKRKTISFWARAATAGKFIAVEGTQVFGTGGAPSAEVNTVSPKKFAITTAWAKYSHVLDFPTIAGKTLGTNNDDFFRVAIWMSASASQDPRNGALGLQTGTIDIARISLVDGDATQEDDPFPFSPAQQELALCQRYFETIPAGVIGAGFIDNATTVRCSVSFAKKRANPTISLTGTMNIGLASAVDPTASAVAFQTISDVSAQAVLTGSGLTAGQGTIAFLNSPGTIAIDAEL